MGYWGRFWRVNRSLAGGKVLETLCPGQRLQSDCRYNGFQGWRMTAGSCDRSPLWLVEQGGVRDRAKQAAFYPVASVWVSGPAPVGASPAGWVEGAWPHPLHHLLLHTRGVPAATPGPPAPLHGHPEQQGRLREREGDVPPHKLPPRGWVWKCDYSFCMQDRSLAVRR